MESLHAMQEFLEKQRRSYARSLGRRPLGAAADEVLGRLIDRVQAANDERPAGAPMTLSFVQGGMLEALTLMSRVVDTLSRLHELLAEAHRDVSERRQPFIALLDRIEADGYKVDLTTFTDVTDRRDWSTLDAVDDPARRVALTAEQITRAEQANIYQQQLKQLDAEIIRFEAGYAERIRTLRIKEG